jgi:hypothetical protein
MIEYAEKDYRLPQPHVADLFTTNPIPRIAAIATYV